MLHSLTAEVLKEHDIAGGVTADNVPITIAIPVYSKWCCQRPAFKFVSLLAEIDRLQEDRCLIFYLATVFDKSDLTIFFAADQIEIAIMVPIEGNWSDHLHVHFQQRSIILLESDPWQVFRITTSPDILKVCEAVEKFAADDIEIAVAIPVGNAGRRPTVGFQHFTIHISQTIRSCILWLLVRTDVSRNIYLAP